MQTLARRLSRRLNGAVWLEASLGPAGAVLTASATAVIVLKMFYPQGWLWGLAAVGALPLAALAGAWRARREGRFFSTVQIIEVLDHLWRDDGSLVAACERPGLVDLGPELMAQVSAELAAREPRLRGKYFLRRLAPALAYGALACVLPIRQAAAVTPPARQVLTSAVRPMTEQLELAQELLPEEQFEELSQQLEQVARSPQGMSRESWEALEEVGQRIEQATARAEQQAQEMIGALNQLSNMGQNSMSGQSPMAQQAQMDAALQELLKSLSKPGAPVNKQLQKELSDLLKQCKPGQPCPKDLQDKLKKLCEKLGNCCKQGEGGMCQSKQGNCPKPGRGGISRGRGDAPLVMGEEKYAAGAKSEQKELSSQFLSPEDLVDLGITPIEPKPDPAAFSPGVARQFTQPQGAPVSTTRISPGQAQVVSQYFATQE